MSQKQELLEAYTGLDNLLKDKKLFGEVVKSVLDKIDIDKSGTVEINELEGFIQEISGEMFGEKEAKKKTGMFDSSKIKELFKELDEDKSGTISVDELATFLRQLFEEQKSQLGKQLGLKKT